MATISDKLDVASAADQIGSVIAGLPGAALLETAGNYGPCHRFSLLACCPRATFSATGQNWTFTGDGPWEVPTASDPLEAIRQLIPQTRNRNANLARNQPFAGGWIGFIGYDVGALIEDVPRRWPISSSIPDIHLHYYDTFALHDVRSNEWRIHAVSSPVSTRSAEDRQREFWRMLDRPAPSVSEGRMIEGELFADFSPDEYCHAVLRIIEYLKQGDIFQANLSQRFSGRLGQSADSLISAVRRKVDAPFRAILRGPGWDVISTSPERFLLVQPDGEIETWPIKGTRPRGRDPIHDLLLRDELISSGKDAAELTMIVDLLRNDLGRVCRYGSVRVDKHRLIESYANVHHAASIVTGRLRPECDFVDLIRATFPGGSITGAPKIRAMQIIDELERGRRGVYTGAIGYISDHGRIDLSIAIRTMLIEQGEVSYRVGGGVVVESDPLDEYRETMAKGRVMRHILTGQAG